MLFRRNNKAFSLTELLTTVGIVGTLSVVGIKSYQKQTNQAKTAEAKKSLAYVYSAETTFYNSWSSYHENLVAVGAVPSGAYSYDVGFGNNAAWNSGGDLNSYPKVDGVNVLNVRECTNFGQICSGECLTALANSITDPNYKAFFTSGGSYNAEANCQVDSSVLLKSYSGGVRASAKADASGFKAIATGQLKGRDIWSINERNLVTHEEDGTQ